MKKILITGKNSYVGTSLLKWLEKYPEKYSVDTISLRNEEWRKKDFSKYDSIVHVAGIAHVSTDKSKEQLYYKVNRDLAIEVAKKAKLSGVKQFIFMSSIIIYGLDGKIGESRIINRNTVPVPVDFYGKSKLEADLSIQKLSSDKFKVVIVRTPMVYGPNCKGNFPKLIKLGTKIPIFPKIENERSMIFIDNLNEFLKKVIDLEKSGVYFPQNKDYVSTISIIQLVSKYTNRKIIFTSIFNPLIKVLSKNFLILNKIFGNKVYSEDLTITDFNYHVSNFEDSIKKSI